VSRFFIDENLQGRRFCDLLTTANVDFTTAKLLGFEGAPDFVWIPQVTGLGMIIVSGDRKFRYVKVEKEAILYSRGRVIRVNQGLGVGHEILGRNFVNSLRRVEEFARRHEPPWIVTLSRPVSVADIHAGLPGALNRVSL